MSMTRREARELAFVLLFEREFCEKDMADIYEDAIEAREIEQNDFSLCLAQLAVEHLEEIDQLIDTHSHKWNRARMSKVALTILRCAIAEMRYMPETPVSVVINEAVELAKKYGGDEDYTFVNGLLGGVARTEGGADA